MLSDFEFEIELSEKQFEAKIECSEIRDVNRICIFKIYKQIRNIIKFECEWDWANLIVYEFHMYFIYIV